MPTLSPAVAPSSIQALPCIRLALNPARELREMGSDDSSFRAKSYRDAFNDAAEKIGDRLGIDIIVDLNDEQTGHELNDGLAYKIWLAIGESCQLSTDYGWWFDESRVTAIAAAIA